jgi:hypothetical protein
MALGWVLRIDPNAYLLLGIPLLLVFQSAIARRPLAELWLKQPPARFITWKGLLAAVPFMIVPVGDAIMEGRHTPWPIRLWYAAAILGAIPLGVTLANATRKTWMALLGCLLTGGVLDIALQVTTNLVRHHGTFHLHKNPGFTVTSWFLLYLPICFSVEEVFFRGGIDSYVQRKGDKLGWLTAAYVSCLWAWWHLPIFHLTAAQLVVLFVVLPPLLCIPGIPFSIFWRRGGSLLVTATVHALLDGVRNAMM